MPTPTRATARPPRLRDRGKSSQFSPGRTIVLELTAHPDAISLLDAIADAYAAGDAPLGERLFEQALDDELPWTDLCAAAARGGARRFGGPRGG
jgi:hypothetical protein